ncbi:flagellar protein FlgN [Celeribacter indicus]|uniref:FlgN-like protein n=1 Tax=Celeribacter indicus TaxID=1208324 RepID=A0A0B5DX45_9RHOB|nr:flagellar protein FlgN [Celeribacter indicus]AJE44802.1 FlgN-like protein [Celeribacter indicus]SDX24665.1 hypothetical protein SAMN05443573_11893 [Celeribacter indicus]
MTILDTFRPAAALSELLDKEREAIRKADFDTLGRLLATKQSLLALVAQAKLPEPVLAELKHRAERNGRLLDACAEGVRAAQERLIAMRASSRSFTAYGPAGQTMAIGGKPLTVTTKL